MINNYSSFLSGCNALASIVTLIASAVSVRSKLSAEPVAFRSHLFTNLMSPDFLDWIHNFYGIVLQIGHRFNALVIF